MTPRKKYLTLLGAMVFAFLYLFVTEVLDRFGDAVDLFGQVETKGNEVLDPEGLIEKRVQLLGRREELTGRVIHSDAPFDQSMTGVYEFLTQCGSSTGVRIESLTPTRNETEGEITGLGFNVTAKAEFHKTCAFISAVESGAVAVALRRIHLSTERRGSSQLLAEIEGVAYVLKMRNPK